MLKGRHNLKQIHEEIQKVWQKHNACPECKGSGFKYRYHTGESYKKAKGGLLIKIILTIFTILTIIIVGADMHRAIVENTLSQAEQYTTDTNTLITRINTLEGSVRSLQGQVDKLEQTITEMEKVIAEFNDTFVISTMEVTAYAPLAEDAVEGWSYQGDPHITASGERVEIGKTVASPLPFGTKIWINGFGWREVQDRGGMVGPGKVDIAVASRSAAYNIGRQDRLVIYKK